jgi:hypothetical protein
MKLYLDNCCFNLPFDDTKWHQQQDDILNIEELSQKAMSLRENDGNQDD